MTEGELHNRVKTALEALEVGEEPLDGLAGSLLWRIGRISDDGPVTIRVGFASSAPHFADLPRLRNASDAEIAAAVEEDAIRVEWVGART